MSSKCCQRRCVICHYGFKPDPRIGKRQRVCGKAECKAELRRRSQAAWRKRHPGYFIQWRAVERKERSESELVEPLRLPAPLSALPWDLAQEEFRVIGADFLGCMGRKLMVYAKDEMRRYYLEITDQIPKVAAGVAKDEIRAQYLVMTDEFQKVGRGYAKDEIGIVAV